MKVIYMNVVWESNLWETQEMFEHIKLMHPLKNVTIYAGKEIKHVHIRQLDWYHENIQCGYNIVDG